VPPLRLDDWREKKADLGFTSFYRKEMFSVLDQLIADCKRDWNRVFANIKPFSVLLPLWEEANEALADSLCMLLGGRITSVNLVGELRYPQRRDKRLVYSIKDGPYFSPNRTSHCCFQ
jgi:hypothetical protein